MISIDIPNMNAPKILRRCLWCYNRIGQVRYFVDGEWRHIFSPHHEIDFTRISDGLCDECYKTEKAKLAQTKIENSDWTPDTTKENDK